MADIWKNSLCWPIWDLFASKSKW